MVFITSKKNKSQKMSENLLKILATLMLVIVFLVGNIAPAHASDIRNVLFIQNDSDGKAVVIDKGDNPNHRVEVDSHEKASTGSMWTPWCDSQEDLGRDEYFSITLGSVNEDKYQVCQHGDYVYYMTDFDYDNKAHVGGDSKEGKGEYTLIINGSDQSPPISYQKDS